MEITKNSLVGDVLDIDPTTAEYFFAMGMHCLGCPSARGESIEDACAVHGVDADDLVAKLNAHIAKQFEEKTAKQKVSRFFIENF